MKSRRGYTMMEVMAALGILAVGASGVIALQKVAIIGNTRAKTLATANGIGVTWIERLRADGLQWNSPTDLASDTTWLNLATPEPDVWIVPTGGEATHLGSPKADVLGADIYDADGDASAQAFCTHLRLTKLTEKLIRAEVRVFWSRAGDPVTCDETPADVTGAVATYGFAYFTTGIEQR